MARKLTSTFLILAGALLVLPVLLGLVFILLNQVSVAIVSPWGILAPTAASMAGLALIWAGLRTGRGS